MSGKNRRRYLTETTLNQEFLDWSHDNLENRLEMICEIESPTGTIYASDRNKYVGGTFYEALLNFPVISRTVGEWLSPELQFSSLQLEISNADGRFNEFLPGGANFDGWIGKSIIVKLGLAEVASTYTTVFKGVVTEVGGFKRTIKSIILIARDDYDLLNVNFPKTALTKASFPDLSVDMEGTIMPIIYGDFTVNLDPSPAVVPTYASNLGDIAVTDTPWNNIQLRISENALVFLDTNNVYLNRGSDYFLVAPSDVVNVGVNNNTFEIQQNTANLWVNGAAYTFESSDLFLVRVKGKDLSGFDDNIIAQAKDLLETQAGISSGSFDANWAAYQAKATPAQSNIAGIKSRIWENEPKPVITFALSLLEQVRLEAFLDRNLMLKLNSLQFEDFVAAPAYTVKNWDVIETSFVPSIDDRNNFNRAQADFDFHPDVNENARKTAIYKNQGSITQIGKAVSKQISFPNLYIEQDVIYQLIEIIRMASSMFEIIDTSFTWRSLLQDIGDFVNIDVKIGSTLFDSVPAMIRNLGYDPQGLKIPVKMWSFAICPFPGYVPGYAGTVGGYNATIVAE